MSITIEELIQNLTESGLLSDEELDTVERSVFSRRQGLSADKAARELVKRKHLTKLQAAAVLKGKTKNLVFGDYIVLDKIGSGGMGQVFKARHKPTSKPVALKVLSADAVKNRRLIERFKKEAKAVARLKHPNVVRAYEAGKINRVRYLVMEFVEGENMLERVKRKGPLSVDECISCVLQAARGLDYAHQKGIVHRDIKPSNLLRDRRSQRIKILDMGLARVEEPDEDDEMRLTMPGQMLGTARFMAPEQIEDARKADVRSDIYSLGCTLHFIMRAKAPYSGETVAHTLMAHVSAPIPDLGRKRDDVPDWLGDVFQKMLAKNPRDRYQTMAELVQVIQYYLGEELTRHDSHVLEEDDVDNDEYSKLLAQRDVSASLEYLYLDPEDVAPVDSKDKDFEAPRSDILKGAPLSDDEVSVPKQAGFTERSPDDGAEVEIAPEQEDGDLQLDDLDEQPESMVFSAVSLPKEGVDLQSGSAADASDLDNDMKKSAATPQSFRMEDLDADDDSADAAEPEQQAAAHSPPLVVSDADPIQEKLQRVSVSELNSQRQMKFIGAGLAGVVVIAVVIWMVTR